LVSSLIWSGGRIGKNIRNVFVLAFVWSIFLAGGIFQGRLVQIAEGESGDFLATGGSIFVASSSASIVQGSTYLLDEPVEHTVLEGETLSAIGQSYNISSESIMFANNLSSENIRVGQTLTIP
ncbi:LysM peptidoglycan-binding domain-containing protein, partial [Arthrospira platensis SPKY2]